jgi:hypothetical protein
MDIRTYNGHYQLGADHRWTNFDMGESTHGRLEFMGIPNRTEHQFVGEHYQKRHRRMDSTLDGMGWWTLGCRICGFLLVDDISHHMGITQLVSRICGF